MRRYVRLVPIVPRVPQQIHISTKHRDVFRRWDNPSHSINVILRTDMYVPKRLPRRQAGYRVVIMRRSVIAAFVLVGDVVAQHWSGDAWCAVGVEIGICAGVSNLRSGDGGNGAAETVSYDHDAVGWVCGGGGIERGEDAGAGFEPTVVTAVVLEYFHIE